MLDYKISLEEISEFLSGYDDEKYIVNLEYDYQLHRIYKVKHTPTGKELVADSFQPFLWMKNMGKVGETIFYGGDKQRQKQAMKDYGIEIEELQLGTPDYDKYVNGYHEKYLNGYKYLVKCNKTYNDLVGFFKRGGVNIWDYKDFFIILKPVEQYLVQTGKRLFKGYEEYNDIHKLVFDLETEGLNPKNNRIFQIGIKDNKGNSRLISVEKNDTSEINAIKELFQTIHTLKPAVIAGYNSEDFDFWFVEERCKQLGIELPTIVKTLSAEKKFRRKEDQVLKIGNETQRYTQSLIWGYSVIDIIHASKKAQAIDSSMKLTNLKYVCKYNKINKDNRVYIQGDKIHETWESKSKFFFNDNDGHWFEHKTPEINFFDTGDSSVLNKKALIVLSTNKPKQMKRALKQYDSEFLIINTNNLDKDKILTYVDEIKQYVKDGYDVEINKDIVKDWDENLTQTFRNSIKSLIIYLKKFTEVNGEYIVSRYLDDDLWETLEVDNVYNQSTFLLSKLVPTTYSKISTMGTASLWQLLMLEWSYNKNMAVPLEDVKRDFTGGLSRLILTGYSKEVVKLDFSSLYPSIMLSHDIFPDVDITGALKSLLKYFHTERFKAKDLSSKYKKEGNGQLSSLYKRKQLPLKILINSLYGALTAPHVFNWSEVDKGEMVTCIGRQYLRLMVAFFLNKGFKPVVMDTDGCNFTVPDNVNDIKYVGRGLHPTSEKGVEYIGLTAVINEYNELFMQGEMALDLDGHWPSTINVKRKNYALLQFTGDVDLTGNSIKSRSLEGYLEDFISKGIKLLLEDKPRDFVEFYNETIETIHDGKVPLSKIASVSKVKNTIDEYLNRGTDVNGNDKAKQIHMELAIQHNLRIDLGDRIYYVNNGTSKSHGDVTIQYKRDENEKLLKFRINDDGNFVKDENGEYIIDKTGEKMEDGFTAYLVPNTIIENEPNKIGPYNIPRAISKLNNRIKNLLVVFKPEIRAKILRDVAKNRKWKFNNGEPKYKLSEPVYFTDEELQLINGEPINKNDQDSLEFLFTPEEKEFTLWNKVEPDYKPDFWLDENFTFHVPRFKKSHLQQ